MIGAKEFFSRIRLMDKKIKGKQREIERMKIEAKNLKASRFSSGVQNFNRSSKVEDAVIGIEQYSNEINMDIQKLIQYKRKVMKKIDLLKNPDEVDVLYKRYFEFMKWEDISEKTHFSIRQIYNIHGSALENFKRIMLEDEWLREEIDCAEIEEDIRKYSQVLVEDKT